MLNEVSVLQLPGQQGDWFPADGRRQQHPAPARVHQLRKAVYHLWEGGAEPAVRGAIYGEDAIIKNEHEITDYKYTNYVYEIESHVDAPKFVFRTTGSNMYGKISMLVGLNQDVYYNEFALVDVYLIIDEQTYASTLEENYIDPLNEGTRDLYDVNCGATYGAKLVRDMVEDAKTAAFDIYKRIY